MLLQNPLYDYPLSYPLPNKTKFEVQMEILWSDGYRTVDCNRCRISAPPNLLFAQLAK